jgi:hypothetical protein
LTSDDLQLTSDDLQRIAVAIEAEVAESTRTTYASGWRRWETWCRRRGLVTLPAETDALAAYLTERAEAGLCNGTLNGDCAAIAYRHPQEGLGDPTATAVVRRAGLVTPNPPKAHWTRTKRGAAGQWLLSLGAIALSDCWDESQGGIAERRSSGVQWP